MNAEALWYVSRATGVVSALLFTAVMVLGVVVSAQGTRRADTAAVVVLLHRWLTMVSVCFLVLHVATAVLDTYVPIPLTSILVPFVGSYHPLWLGLGTVSTDLMVAIIVTAFARRRLPEVVFRAVHWLAYLSWPVAMMHSIALGSSDQRGLTAVSLVCLAVGGAAVTWRLLHESLDRRRRTAVAGQEWR